MQNSQQAQFYDCIKDILEIPSVQSMSDLSHHVNVSCLEHSVFVSYISYKLCRFFKLDYVAAARGGLLHDLFLYNWRTENNRRKYHLISHPIAALENASKLFKLSDIEKDIIRKHMWPLTIKLPKYKESFIVSLADKYCAIVEMLFIYKHVRNGSVKMAFNDTLEV